MSAQPAPADPGAWKVTNPGTPTVASDSTGKAVPGRVVVYQLAAGQTGQVFVPDTVTDPANIKAMIAADAARLAAIANLTSQS